MSPNVMDFFTFIPLCGIWPYWYPLLNPELYWVTYSWLNPSFLVLLSFYLQFLSLALLPSLCVLSFYFWAQFIYYHLCANILNWISSSYICFLKFSLLLHFQLLSDSFTTISLWYLKLKCLQFNLFCVFLLRVI